MAWSGFSQARLEASWCCRNHRAGCSRPATAVFFQRQPWSYCAKPARIQFGSGWLRQVWAKWVHFGSKPVCKNHRARFWLTLWQCLLLAPSVRGRQMVWACVWGRNELEVCTVLAYPRISSFRTMLVLYASAHLQTAWGQRTNRAKSGYCQRFQADPDRMQSGSGMFTGQTRSVALIPEPCPLPGDYILISCPWTASFEGKVWPKWRRDPGPCHYFPNQFTKWWLWPFAYSVWAPLSTWQIIYQSIDQMVIVWRRAIQ